MGEFSDIIKSKFAFARAAILGTWSDKFRDKCSRPDVRLTVADTTHYKENKFRSSCLRLTLNLMIKNYRIKSSKISAIDFTWLVFRSADDTVGSSASSDAFDWYSDDRIDEVMASCEIPFAIVETCWRKGALFWAVTSSFSVKLLI